MNSASGWRGGSADRCALDQVTDGAGMFAFAFANVMFNGFLEPRQFLFM
jgi:hypothetical protein